MNIQLYKKSLEEALMNRDIYTKRVNRDWIQTRCPYCGDSHKRMDTGHFYIRLNPDDNQGIGYHCFKCPASGSMNKETLSLLNVDSSFLEGITMVNKYSDKRRNDNNEAKTFVFELPENYTNAYKIKYIENRLQRNFTEEELKDMRVITSLNDFLKKNEIEYYNCKEKFAQMLESKYIGFLSNNGAYILFRDITDKSDISWYKYPISKESIGQKCIYSLSTEVDLFSNEIITINLSEGVFDCLSINYNLNENNTYNTLNIAICGKHYYPILKYLIGMGFVGSNIVVNIYADNDYTEDTSIDYYRNKFKDISFLFKEMNVFYNTKSKDCGVGKDAILLLKYKI